jgi:type II secretory pathway pseudopilin PulG
VRGGSGSYRRTAVRSAFKLVELLVVIGVIAILIGLLMPSPSRARENARRVNCMSNMRRLTTAWVAYAQQNKGQLVFAENWPNGLPWAGPFNSDEAVVEGLLYPWVPDARVYRCPMTRSGRTSAATRSTRSAIAPFPPSRP